VIDHSFLQAEWAYNKYKEHEIADKLKEGIVHLCTARLYATQDKDTAETFSSLSVCTPLREWVLITLTPL
jgi:hypothetical protein